MKWCEWDLGLTCAGGAGKKRDTTRDWSVAACYPQRENSRLFRMHIWQEKKEKCLNRRNEGSWEPNSSTGLSCQKVVIFCFSSLFKAGSPLTFLNAQTDQILESKDQQLRNSVQAMKGGCVCEDVEQNVL